MGQNTDTAGLLECVNPERLRGDLFSLSASPLPYRKANFTLPGHAKNTLDEADDLIADELGAAGLAVTREPCRVQAFRCDKTKNIHHWYSSPAPEDPWYTVHNLYAELPGTVCPERIILLISHKDSMSWIDSPGAHDNAAGTVANMEIARLLTRIELRHTVRFLFCNEEHTPWTSQVAAAGARQRGDDLVAILNLDSLDGKAPEDMAAGTHTHVARYATEEGKELAEFLGTINQTYAIGLRFRTARTDSPGDDDGVFIKAGFPAAIANLGSYPYADSEYHLPTDTPDRIDLDNLGKSTRLLLAAVLELDRIPG